MFTQANDFAAECLEFSDAIDRELSKRGAALFLEPTQFKRWTLNDILSHLHVWNWAADTSLSQPEHFQEFLALAMPAYQRGQMREFERQWIKDLEGPALFESWRDYAADMSSRFLQADPRARVQWVGPDMSVRSCISARLMETWAHAQAFFDLAGAERVFHDRLENLVILGVNTFAWTFRNRGLEPPDTLPHVSLVSPSSSVWQFGEPNNNECISGTASDFCQVVTQVRNVQDTDLTVTGENATQWMNIAQCFAGAPEDPPAPGTRFRQAQK